MNRRKFLTVTTLGAIGLSSNLYASNDLIKSYQLNNTQRTTLNSIRKKLSKIQRHVGYGNFNILSFDEALKITKINRNIGRFTKEEMELIEELFYYNPTSHGFYGQRISNNLIEIINKKDIYKVPKTGHYLFKGIPLDTYNEMVKDVGNTLYLTSGIRSIVKQMKLFFDKIERVNGDIQLAAISIAPPAYTYHTVGDFDVGKKGLGSDNFTSRFALTKEYKEIKKLEYLDVRYQLNNKDGVRYEPWHITTV